MNEHHSIPSDRNIGLSGRLAGLFLHSKITPLLIVAALLMGALAVFITPREEEPQIVVPMADVFIPFPGASSKEVEDLVIRPIERKLSEIREVEYVYSTARPGIALITVRFFVGREMEKSLVDLYDKLMSNRDLLPPGSGDFMVKPRDINDVPIVTLTLWSEQEEDDRIRRVADRLLEELKKIPQTSGGFVVGGRERQFRVLPDPGRLKEYQLSLTGIASTLERVNQNLPSGRFSRGNREYIVETGPFIRTIEDLRQVVVAVRQDRPVFLKDVADLIDGPEEPAHYVWFGRGLRESGETPAATPPADQPAVTLAIAKQKGTNAVAVSSAVSERVDALKGSLIPSNIHVTVTRDYGETADEKANELFKHLLFAVLAVVVFLGLALGLREAAGVSLAIPLTLAMTLFVSFLIGYTINRVTLFALIFSIGILVDDAIVVVENIYRHLRLKGAVPDPKTVIRAVDEVGNPTILATFTVIAALLPMAFVSGLMGPYMRPIPVNASIAMFFSLLAAFIIIPWFCRFCHKRAGTGPIPRHDAGSGDRFYRALLAPFLDDLKKRLVLFGGIVLLLLGALSFFYFKWTVVKMLPFDNKSELQLVIDMPEGTPLEETGRVAKALSAYVRTIPEVSHYQAYVGMSSPFNFNGLVRHYFLREGGAVADIQINLAGKHERDAQSHEIARRIRPEVAKIARQYNANVKVVEVPPGPPVQSALVAELYGPDDAERTRLTRQVRQVFEETPGIVDVDDTLEADQVKYRVEIDRVKAGLAGISSDEIARTLKMALDGETAGLAHIPHEKSPVPIRVQLPRAERAGVSELQQIGIRRGETGAMIPLSELVRFRETTEDRSIHHKNLKPVTYVVGDVTGKEESPAYGILNLGRRLEQLPVSGGQPLKKYYTAQPETEDQPALKWDGEWQITYETFRDMGAAFGVALLLIYLLIVAQFQSFLIPLVIMAPIPLTLIGIVPGHWITGGYFTATSMIGFIALSGIIVRNSIILVDFIQKEEAAGTPLREAVIRSVVIRTRPILLTAAALMVGSFVIILDPIFQGLAVSMLFGVFVSTLLTLVVIPLLYYSLQYNLDPAITADFH